MNDVISQDRIRDEAELRARMQALNDAWAAGDADAYAAEFAEDVRYVVFDGSCLRGRAEIAAAHRPLFERYLRGSRLYGESSEIRFPADDVAIIHSKGAVLKRGQRRPSKRGLSVQTWVAVRRNGTWSFVAFHNTRYRPFHQTLLGRVLTLLSR